MCQASKITKTLFLPENTKNISKPNLNEGPGFNFINFFAPYALALNFCASKKLIKKLGVGVGRKWIEQPLCFAPCAQLYEINPKTEAHGVYSID